jgi:hypothetical protein
MRITHMGGSPIVIGQPERGFAFALEVATSLAGPFVQGCPLSTGCRPNSVGSPIRGYPIAADQFLIAFNVTSIDAARRVGVERMQVVYRVALGAALVAGFAMMPSAWAQPVDGGNKKPFSLTTSFSSEFFIVDWSGTRGTNTFAPERGKGSQVYAPQSLTVVAEWARLVKWETTAKAGYVYSTHRTDLQEASISTFNDTQLGTKFTLLGNASLQPFFGITTNLPTGQPFLPGLKRFTRMDSDLVEIGSYGAGTSITPTVGASVAITSGLVVTPSFGYTFNRAFIREGGVPGSDAYTARVFVDPGDSLTATLNLSAKGNKWDSDLSTTFKAERATHLGGLPVSRSGNNYAINANFNYEFTNALSLKLDGSWSLSNKNQDPLRGNLVTEPKNSNSHLLTATVQPTLKLNEKTAVHIGYSFLYRNNNAYDVAEDRFSPAKIKHTFGAGVAYDLSPTTALSLNVHRFWVKERVGASALTATDVPQDPFIDPTNPASESNERAPPALTYHGWNVSTSLRINF